MCVVGEFAATFLASPQYPSPPQRVFSQACFPSPPRLPPPAGAVWRGEVVPRGGVIPGKISTVATRGIPGLVWPPSSVAAESRR